MNRATLNEKVTKALSQRSLGALLVCGPDNVQYLTGVCLPMLPVLAARQPLVVVWSQQQRACVVPAALASSLSAAGWTGAVLPYPEGPDPAAEAARLVAGLVAGLPEGAPLGVDMERFTAGQLARLRAALPGRELVSADDLLRTLRQVKTEDEIELLERLAAMTDHGVAGAMHHVSTLGGRTEKFMCEDLRVHCLERGTDLAPYHGLSLTASGPHARVFWPVSPRFGIGQEKKMQPGEAVRMEMRASLDGYWADSARTLTMGQPDPDQAKGYAHLRELTAAALSALRTGARACDVYAAVSARAAELGADWISGLGAGHGVGVTPYEAPYLTAWDETRLEAGMVLVIDLAVRLPGGEILRGKETVTLAAEGPRLAETYQDWRQPYTAALTF